MVTEWYHLPTGDVEECRRRVREMLLEDSFLYSVVEGTGVPRKAWFVRDELTKLLRSYLFNGERSLGFNPYTESYFNPLRWPTILLGCTAMRCALMDYQDTGRRAAAVSDFSHVGFHGWQPSVSWIL
jgi:hypothetical protein